MPAAEVEVREEHVVGLRLPNGAEIWPGDVWHNHGVATREEREEIVQALVESSGNLGMDTADLLASYAWISRTDKVYTFRVSGEVEASPLFQEPIDAEVVEG